MISPPSAKPQPRECRPKREQAAERCLLAAIARVQHSSPEHRHIGPERPGRPDQPRHLLRMPIPPRCVQTGDGLSPKAKRRWLVDHRTAAMRAPVRDIVRVGLE